MLPFSWCARNKNSTLFLYQTRWLLFFTFSGTPCICILTLMYNRSIQKRSDICPHTLFVLIHSFHLHVFSRFLYLVTAIGMQNLSFFLFQPPRKLELLQQVNCMNGQLKRESMSTSSSSSPIILNSSIVWGCGTKRRCSEIIGFSSMLPDTSFMVRPSCHNKPNTMRLYKLYP